MWEIAKPPVPVRFRKSIFIERDDRRTLGAKRAKPNRKPDDEPASDEE